MKIYLDTNIIIDALDPTREGYEDACTILHLAKEHKIELFLSTHYSARKHAPSLKLLRQSLFELTQFVNIVSIHQFGVAKALKAGVSDVEDLAQAATADAESCQLVITNDKDFPYYPDVYPIPQMSSKTFVEMCRSVEVS